MANISALQQRLAAEFTEAYLEKVFYFCLKKTGNPQDAEELTQEIAFHVISGLYNGTIPMHYSAWVWQIARNRYSVWAKMKHIRREMFSGCDIDEYEIEDLKQNILNECLYTEQIALLRRELSFIKSDYRNIVVAYYIENKSLKEIGADLSIPFETVKKRLQRARTILKEGMEMTREFGKRSYKPENFAFINNGMFGANGEPMTFLSRALCKNILLAAYRSPSTAEELAVEVGVSLPYMEDELERLEAATLMKRKGNKYETNLFIVSAEAQEIICAHKYGLVSELTQAIIDIVEYDVKWKNENCPHWHGGYQPYEDMKWFLLMQEADTIRNLVLRPYNRNACDVPNIGPWGHTIRPNGGEWDVLGMEIVECKKPAFVGLCGCVSSPNERDLPEINFRQFKFQYCGIENETPNILGYGEGQALMQASMGNTRAANSEMLKNLENYGYIRRTENGYEPTILVQYTNEQKQMANEAKNELHKLRGKAVDIATRHYLFCREQIHKEIPEALMHDEYQVDHACGNIFDIRGAVLEEAIEQGYLHYSPNEPKRMLGACITI